MCFFGGGAPPAPKIPQTPSPDDDAVRMRQQQELAALSQQSGTLSTIKTDLDPSKLAGQRRVLLGQ